MHVRTRKHKQASAALPMPCAQFLLLSFRERLVRVLEMHARSRPTELNARSTYTLQLRTDGVRTGTGSQRSIELVILTLLGAYAHKHSSTHVRAHAYTHACTHTLAHA